MTFWKGLPGIPLGYCVFKFASTGQWDMFALTIGVMLVWIVVEAAR